MLRYLYIFSIGLLFAAFVGLGFSAFYPEPKSPEYPAILSKPTSSELTAAQQSAQASFDQAQKDYQNSFETYSRNLSIWLIAAALIILAVSILGLGKILIIGDGLTLGGVFTLFYGLIRAMMGGDEKMRFIAVSFGLVVLIFLAYWKFIRKTGPVTPV